MSHRATRARGHGDAPQSVRPDASHSCRYTRAAMQSSSMTREFPEIAATESGSGHGSEGQGVVPSPFRGSYRHPIVQEDARRSRSSIATADQRIAWDRFAETSRRTALLTVEDYDSGPGATIPCAPEFRGKERGGTGSAGWLHWYIVWRPRRVFQRLRPETLQAFQDVRGPPEHVSPGDDAAHGAHAQGPFL
jgi:hypothetical protein